MHFQTLFAATMAALATATAIPKEARAVTGSLSCGDPALGPILYQFERAISALGGHGEDVFTLPQPGTCARIETYGTAGLNLCGASRPGGATTAFKYRDLVPYFTTIAKSCAGPDAGIWTRAQGAYTLDSSVYPNGTIWAYVYTEAIGPLGP